MKMRTILLILISVTGLFGSCVKDSTDMKITRRPYLQNVWADSASVVWKTTLQGNSCFVKYGVNQLSNVKVGTTAKNPDGSFTHTVTITGLQPGLRYKYAIYNDSVKLDDSPLNYIDAQRIDTTQGFRFIAMGDIGRNPFDDGFPGMTAKQITQQVNHPDFIIGLGDIVYPLGEADKYDPYLFQPFANVFSNVPFYPVLGNHDWGVNPEGNFCNEWKLPNNEHYYSYNYLNTHFICLDSKEGDFYEFGAQKAWLINDLQLAQGHFKWIIVSLHHPGRTCTYKNDEPNVISLYPIFAQYNVDFVLNGHAHTYERLHPYDAAGNVLEQYRNDTHHYPDIENGFISITTGAGGVLESNGWQPGNCPENITAATHHTGHFMEFHILGNTLTGKAIDSHTGQVFDEFEVVK